MVIFVQLCTARATYRRGKTKRQAGSCQSIDNLCPKRETADSLLLFNLEAMPLGDKDKAAWPLKTVTLKRQGSPKAALSVLAGRKINQGALGHIHEIKQLLNH